MNTISIIAMTTVYPTVGSLMAGVPVDRKRLILVDTDAKSVY